MPIEEPIKQLDGPLDEADIDIGILQKIHYGKDAFIAFGRKPKKPRYDRKGKLMRFEPMFTLQADELQTYLPEMRKYLLEDSYFTINSPFAAAPYLNKETGLPAVGVLRREKWLKYLNAVYVDLDVGRIAEEAKVPSQTLTWRDAMNIAGKMMDDGLLPQASIFARSGRGVYIIWQLRDPETGEPPRASLWKIRALYKPINRAIGARCREIAADEVAFDAARVLRVPGSYHTGAKSIARYLPQLNDLGHPYLYTLNDLAAFFGISMMRQELPERARDSKYRQIQQGKRRTAPKRRKGWETLQRRRIDDLLIIEQYRQGFPHGRRRRCLHLYAELLFNLDCTPEEIKRAVGVMAGNCKPPYPSDESDMSVREIVDDVFAPDPDTGKPKKRFHKAAHLCGLLEITPQLATDLELQTIIPEELREDRKKNRPPSKREIERERRLDALTELVYRFGKGHSCRTFHKALESAGIKSNRQTVNVELRSIGYELPKQGRTKRGDG